jgi:hypothetical protein
VSDRLGLGLLPFHPLNDGDSSGADRRSGEEEIAATRIDSMRSVTAFRQEEYRSTVASHGVPPLLRPIAARSAVLRRWCRSREADREPADKRMLPLSTEWYHIRRTGRACRPLSGPGGFLVALAPNPRVSFRKPTRRSSHSLRQIASCPATGLIEMLARCAGGHKLLPDFLSGRAKVPASELPLRCAAIFALGAPSTTFFDDSVPRRPTV